VPHAGRSFYGWLIVAGFVTQRTDVSHVLHENLAGRFCLNGGPDGTAELLEAAGVITLSRAASSSRFKMMVT
jgi:hypothetical protein